MSDFYVARDGAIGFGENRELAEADLYINLCRKDLSNDTKHLFDGRRQELMPWMPKENMLHIKGLGCLVYQDGFFTNTKNGRSIELINDKVDIFYCLAELFGDSLSYTDIVVVLARELDQLFRNVSKNIRLIKDMPVIRVTNTVLGFAPEQIYTFDNGVVIGISGAMFGMKITGDSMFHVVDKESKYDTIMNCAYLGYKLGVIVSQRGVRLYGEED